MTVYKAINAVQSELAREGIAKNRKNEQQGYKFRGIDEVYNALAPMLARHGLCILPRCTERVCVERVNAKGTALFYVTVRAEFDFVSSEDGSSHTVVTYGEAMDSGDKATNKAMSAAYKYACMQAFSIPTEGDNDADSTTHEVKPRAPNAGVKADFLHAHPAISDARQRELAELADIILRDYFEPYGAQSAFERLQEENLEVAEKVFLSAQWKPAVQRAMKQYSVEFHSQKAAKQ